MTEVSHQPCPYCDSSDAYSYNTEKNVYRCFSCGASGVLNKNPRSGNEEEEGLTLEPYIKDAYRGITKDTMDKFGVYFTTQDGKETVHYTYPNGIKHRELPKQIKISGKVDRFYGQDDYTGGKNITITEGEEDRLSVIQIMGDWPCVSVPGATPSKAFWESAERYLKNFERIVLSVDNDKPGNDLADKIYRMFPGKVYRVNHGKYKDANDFLQSGERQAYKSAWWNAQIMKPDNILCTKEDFINLFHNTPDYEYFKTGIPELDKKMMGIHKGAFTVILAPTGIGKSLAPSTPVLRYDGKVVRADEVQVGDQLMGPDSKPRNVTNVNLQEGPMYRVTPVKGEPFECNADHILSLRHTSTGEIKNVVLTEYLDWTKGEKHLWKLWRTGVKPDWNGIGGPDLAYAIGAYLGDGRSQGPEICMGKKKEPVFQYMMDTGYLKPTRMKFERGAYYIGFSTKCTLWEYLTEGDYLVNRCMPDYMKRGNTDVRKSILAGLLDTDGSLTNGGAEITQKSEQLADDICFVSRSLGLAAYKKSKWVSGQEYFRVTISGDMTTIPCKRLKFKPRKQVKNVLNTGFTVEPIGNGTYRGIALDGDHLFLLGDFTVTHNTEFMRYLEWQLFSTTDMKFAYYHGEESELRSILGLFSYDQGEALISKEVIQAKGKLAEYEDFVGRFTKDERAYQYRFNYDDSVEDIVDRVRFFVEVFGVDYVFFEPIQDFVTGNTTEKENKLTDLTNLLKRTCVDLGVGVVVIAHANEDGEAKYCKSITQGAAYEINLKRDGDNEDADIANTTYVGVGRKNRTGGGSGPAGNLYFDRETYTLIPDLGPEEPVFDNTDMNKAVGF